MYEEEQELLDKIEIIHPNEIKIQIKAVVNSDELINIAELVTKYNPMSQEGFDFWYKYCNKDDLFKLAFVLDQMGNSKDIPALVSLVCKVGAITMDDILNMPCEAVALIDNVGHLNGVETIFDFYVNQEELEKAHKLVHEVKDALFSYKKESGWETVLHKN